MLNGSGCLPSQMADSFRLSSGGCELNDAGRSTQPIRAAQPINEIRKHELTRVLPLGGAGGSHVDCAQAAYRSDNLSLHRQIARVIVLLSYVFDDLAGMFFFNDSHDAATHAGTD
jgi:hypothetical protein